MKKLILPILFSLCAIALLYVHLLNEKITIDATAITIFLLIFLPWIIPYIKEIEFPGGGKITFKDVVRATDKITQYSFHPSGGLKIKKDTSADVEFVDNSEIGKLKVISESNPSLALVGFRIALENRLRKIGIKNNIDEKTPLTKIVKLLEGKSIINENVAKGLIELIQYGNQASHGKKIEDNAVEYMLNKGDGILEYLDKI